MTFQVQRIGDMYGVLFTEEQVRAAGLHEGMHVDIQLENSENAAGNSRAGSAEDVQYCSLEEGLAAFERSEERWSHVYRELAK